MWQLPQGIVKCFVYVPRTQGLRIRAYDDIAKYYREKKIDAFIQCQDPEFKYLDEWDCYAILESGEAVLNG